MVSALHRRVALCALAAALTAHAQTPKPSDKDIRAADDAYIAGARSLAANDPIAAERSFARAVKLDPTKFEYAQSFAIARQHHVTLLIQQAAQARRAGHNDDAQKLIAEAQVLDPDNPLVTEHLPTTPLPDLPRGIPYEETAHLGGAVRLAPTPGTQSIHRRDMASDILRDVYNIFGIKAVIDPSVTPQQIRFDLDDADFPTLVRILQRIAHVFAVPLTPQTVLIAKDTQENRDKYMPQIEETVFVPAMSTERLTELATVAKSIFDIKQVTVGNSGNQIVLRGPEDALTLVNAAYADLIDGGAEVLLDVHIYEIDKTHARNIGFSLPNSFGAVLLAPALQNFVNTNQTLLNQIIATGALNGKLGKGYYSDLATEAFALIAAGVPLPSSLSNLLGFFGNFGKYTDLAGNLVGIPLAGLTVGSGATFNLALNSSDVRLVDDIQLRTSDRALSTFRAGVRYPITTATYSSGLTSAQSSALAGVKIGGVSASTLLAQASSSTVPQVQFEDLGLTLKATPQVLKSGQVYLKLDMKIEALGGSQINNIPILNSRQLTSDVTVPEGQTVMLASQISVQESGAISGVPGLNEVPGFDGTDKSANKDTQELLITITPHIIRRRSPTILTRRISANLAPQTE